ncbi:MAG TPA: amino acid permease [Anaerolineaceae bacterium]|nr:amino acid permease [Chloroflexota bacterium]HOA21042.1 amino acid permease [Anaerolineaceae bacterium]
MAKRKLKRQLNLLQVIMLGTAGTIAAEIFVLTGHAAGIAGPEAVLALVLGGVLTLSVALNYCELATTYPVTGGAMTYVGQGFGSGLIMFLVGSLDCLSSTFYAALSAIGFAISLKVFFPILPLVPVALAVIVVVAGLHARGVNKAGNFQIVLGAFLLVVFAIYIIRGMTDANGFSQAVFSSGNVVFSGQNTFQVIARMLSAIALTYNAYVGFEVIADDAEEITQPNRNIPLGILLSLGIATLVYSMVSLVTIGTIPFQQLAGSTTALTDAAAKFWPNGGVQIMAAAGIVATLTSVNSAMLSATREAFTLSRERVWPRVFSRLSRWRTPYAAIILIALISGLISAIGVVDFLSYISSAGYMFVLFWASLAMLRLRKDQPNIERPFKVPLYPLTPYLAAASGVLIVAFADPKALLFLAAVLAGLSVVFWVTKFYKTRSDLQQKLEHEEGGGRILAAAVHQDTAISLTRLAAQLVDQQEDTSICVFSVKKTPFNLSEGQVPALVQEQNAKKKQLLAVTAPIAQSHNVPLYVKSKAARHVEEAVYDELARHRDISMVLLGYPKDESKVHTPNNILKEIVMTAQRNVGVLRDRGLVNGIHRVLVPVGNGPNARLALRLARDLASPDPIPVTALRLTKDGADPEVVEDQLAQLHDIVEFELGEIPPYIELKVELVSSVLDGILEESRRGNYDLMIIGAAEEVLSPEQIFGELNDNLLEEAECSILVVRQYQPTGTIWLHKQLKRIEE